MQLPRLLMAKRKSPLKRLNTCSRKVRWSSCRQTSLMPSMHSNGLKWCWRWSTN